MQITFFSSALRLRGFGAAFGTGLGFIGARLLSKVLSNGLRETGGLRALCMQLRKLALLATVYFVWLARNTVIKDGKRFDDRRILFQIKIATYSILYVKFPPDQVAQHVPDI